MLRQKIFYVISAIFSVYAILYWQQEFRSLAPAAVEGKEPPRQVAPELMPLLAMLENPASAWSRRDTFPPAGPALAPAVRQRRDELTAMIRSYAPRIWWHPAEKYGPMDPLRFLQASSLWIHHRWRADERIAARGSLDARELGIAATGAYARLGAKPADEAIVRGVENSFYLKMEGDPTGSSRSLDPALGTDAPIVPVGAVGVIDGSHAPNPPNLNERRHPATGRVPILWKLGRSSISRALGPAQAGHARIALEYWYHAAYNAASSLKIGNHQGDWEGMAHVIDLSLDASGHIKHKLVMSYLAAHEDGAWQCALDLDFAGQHPVVYSAIGTHATYGSEGSHKAAFITDHTAKGKHWDTWNLVHPMALEPYFGFAGAWGELGVFSFMSGPSAPGPWKLLPKNPGHAAPLSEPLKQRCQI